MIYFYIVSAILLFYFLILGENLYQDSKSTEIVGVKILFCFILTLLYRCCWGYYFWGLEYEDSYCFSFLAREFAHSIYTDSFLAEGVVCGSLDEAYMMGQYGGHFITYSVFLSYFVKIFGFSSILFSYITTFLSFISLFMLSIFPYKVEHSWWLAPILYCVAPIVNTFSNTLLCEPFSCFVILSFVYAYYKNSDIIFILVSFFVAILCKRENLILLVLPFYTWITNFKTRKRTAGLLISMLILTVCYFIFIQNVFKIERVESIDIDVPTFSLLHFVYLFPWFIKSLFSLSFFSIISYILIAIIVLSVKYEKIRSKIQISLLFLAFVYLLLYSFHYRGYYFVKYGQISVFETFRYINNFYVLIPISLGAIPTKKYIKGCILFLVLFSMFQTFYLRKYYSAKEKQNRFYDVSIVVSIMGDSEKINRNNILFTDDILLYQNVCTHSFNICDIRYLGKVKIRSNVNKYIVIKDLETLESRYQVKFDKTQYDIVKKLRNGTLYKMRDSFH